MGLIAGQVYKEMDQAIRGAGSAALSKQDVANDMGEMLCSLRSWKWKEPRPRYFDLRGILESAVCEFDYSALGLSPSSGETDVFANYSRLDGDVVLLNSGTGLATGFTGKRVNVVGFNQTSALTGNAELVLDEDIGGVAGDLTTGDLNVTLRLDTFAVEEDIKEVIDVEVTDGLFNGITLTTKRDLLRKRTSQLETTSPWEYYVAFSWPEDTNGIPYPVGEVWPAPQADATQAFMGWCKTGWAYLTSETSVVRLPTWLYRLYKQLCREAWMGLHDHDGVGYQARVAAVLAGQDYDIARKRDAAYQADKGPIRHGHAERADVNYSLFNNDSLMGGPS